MKAVHYSVKIRLEAEGEGNSQKRWTLRWCECRIKRNVKEARFVAQISALKSSRIVNRRRGRNEKISESREEITATDQYFRGRMNAASAIEEDYEIPRKRRSRRSSIKKNPVLRLLFLHGSDCYNRTKRLRKLSSARTGAPE